jgi:hypothetical protein
VYRWQVFEKNKPAPIGENIGFHRPGQVYVRHDDGIGALHTLHDLQNLILLVILPSAQAMGIWSRVAASPSYGAFSTEPA